MAKRVKLFEFLGTEKFPDEIEVRDVTYPKGVPVEVEDADTQRKLAGWPCFRDVTVEVLESAEDDEPPTLEQRIKNAKATGIPALWAEVFDGAEPSQGITVKDAKAEMLAALDKREGDPPSGGSD